MKSGRFRQKMPLGTNLKMTHTFWNRSSGDGPAAQNALRTAARRSRPAF